MAETAAQTQSGHNRINLMPGQQLPVGRMAVLLSVSIHLAGLLLLAPMSPATPAQQATRSLQVVMPLATVPRPQSAEPVTPIASEPRPPEPEPEPEPESKPKPKPKPEPKPIKPNQSAPVTVPKSAPSVPEQKQIPTTAHSNSAQHTPAAEIAFSSASRAKQILHEPTLTSLHAQSENLYLARISAAIQKQQRYPKRSRQRQEDGVVTLQLQVNRAGTLSSLSLMHSSGYPRLDREAQRMVRVAAPFPALPADLKENILTLILPIRFDLTDK